VDRLALDAAPPARPQRRLVLLAPAAQLDRRRRELAAGGVVEVPHLWNHFLFFNVRIAGVRTFGVHAFEIHAHA